MYSSSSKKSLPVRKQIPIKDISIPARTLPTQEYIDSLEIRFTNCIFTYKLKHIETLASKSRRRKVGKVLGYSFRPLKIIFSEKQEELLFKNCIFNPSDKSIVEEHIKIFESPRIRFINCKFLRRDSLFKEKLDRMWRWLVDGMFVKFRSHGGNVEIESEVLKLKDLPILLEYVLENVDKAK